MLSRTSSYASVRCEAGNVKRGRRRLDARTSSRYGVGPAVCVVKLFAIGLIWLRLTAPPELARGAGAAALAAFYAVVVLMPWATAFANRGDVAPEQRAVGGSGAPP